jgi:nucleoside-diphosphate-sugar epimerase
VLRGQLELDELDLDRQPIRGGRSGPCATPAPTLTVLRSTWFAQNFGEDYWREQVQSNEVALPAGDTPEPFVDADDIADVAVAALTEDRHIGEIYDLTGPLPLTFAEAVLEVSRAPAQEPLRTDLGRGLRRRCCRALASERDRRHADLHLR